MDERDEAAMMTEFHRTHPHIHIPHPHIAARQEAFDKTAQKAGNFNSWLAVKITNVVGTM